MKNNLLTTFGASASLFIAGQVGAQVIISEDFSAPVKQANASVNGFLGTGGAGFDYNSAFGTWMYHDFNGGIDEAAQGLGDGSSNGNQISSIGLSRSQDFRGSNARANWAVFAASNFTAGVEYRVSFDVIGDEPGSNDTGRYWLAALSGYDTSGNNYIQGAGAFGGWGAGAGTPKPWTAVGTATVNFLADAATNGILIPAADLAATTVGAVSFDFTYAAGTDIGFAVGTFSNVFAIDNFSIAVVPEPSSFAFLAGLGVLGVIMLRRRRS